MNERDKKLFDYACFIDVNKFWSGFEDIRDINHEKWPMLIDAGNMNEYPDFHRLLAKSKRSGEAVGNNEQAKRRHICLTARGVIQSIGSHPLVQQSAEGKAGNRKKVANENDKGMSSAWQNA